MCVVYTRLEHRLQPPPPPPPPFGRLQSHPSWCILKRHLAITILSRYIMCSVCSSYLSPALVLSISFGLISPSPCKISVSHAVSCVSQLTISYSVLCRSLSCFKKTFFSLSLFPLAVYLLGRSIFSFCRETPLSGPKSLSFSLSSLPKFQSAVWSL